MGRVEPLPRRRDELDEDLARVAGLANDEMAQVAAAPALVVSLEPLLPGPLSSAVADRVAELGRQPAALDLEHTVPPAGGVKAQRRPLLELRERVLQLVAVPEDLRRRHDRLRPELRQARDAPQRVGDLGLLLLELRLVREVLEAAASARGVVRAGRLHPLRPGRQDLGRERLRVVALDLRDAGADGVAGKATAHEDDEAVQARDAVAAVGERVDPELDLLSGADRGGHGPRG